MRAWRAAGTTALWVVQVLAAAAFIAIGVAKFGDPAWARNFARWGYPDGFYLVIGGLECAGGLLLLAPMLTSYAATFLAAIMIGAAATHALHNETARIRAPLMWLGILALLALARRRRAWRPRRRAVVVSASRV